MLKLNFLCQIKFESNFILSKKIKSNFLDYDLCFKFFFKLFASTKIKQIKSNQIYGIMFFISNFFQIICFNKIKTNQIKSNLWDNVFYLNFFSNFSLQQKEIKSNPIKFLGSGFVFQMFFKFLGLRFNLPNQIKSNFVAIIWLVKLKQIILIWFEPFLGHFKLFVHV